MTSENKNEVVPMKASGTDRFSDWFFGSLPGIFKVLYKSWDKELNINVSISIYKKSRPGKRFREARWLRYPLDAPEHLPGSLCPKQNSVNTMLGSAVQRKTSAHQINFI